MSEAKQLKVNITTFNKRQFYPEFQADLKEIQNILASSAKSYNNKIDVLINALNEKFKSPFTDINIQTISGDIQSSLEDSISRLNALTGKNNEVTNSFGTGKSDAIHDLKQHYISELYFEIPIAKKNQLKKIITRQKKWFGSAGKALKEHNQELEAKISLAQKGREEINRYISGFLGRDEVQIDVVKVGDVEQFRLVREGEIAKNLSEGEKTARISVASATH